MENLATVVKKSNGYFQVVLASGVVLIDDESFGVADSAAFAINSPADWEPTEAYEIAALVRFDYDMMTRG